MKHCRILALAAAVAGALFASAVFAQENADANQSQAEVKDFFYYDKTIKLESALIAEVTFWVLKRERSL